MNIFKTVIDVSGIILEMLLVSMFYKIVFSEIKYSKNLVIFNYFIAIIFKTMLVTLSQKSMYMPIFALLIIFALSFNYKSKILLKILYAFCCMLIFVLSEMITGMGLAIISQSVEGTYTNLVTYLAGVLICELLALIIIKIISIISVSKAQNSNKFSLLILLYPFSSLALCFLIYLFAIHSSEDYLKFLMIISILILILANIFIFKIIENQTAYELANQKMAFIEMQLSAQISHYKEMSEAQKEVRNIRHDIKNNLIALNGLLNKNNIQKAQSFIDKLTGEIESSFNIVDTGLPAIDAILMTKMKQAEAINANIEYKILLDGLNNIDQMDISIIIASALDNAVEALKLCESSKREIFLNIISYSDYISIKVENPIDKPMRSDFTVTSKNDKLNHGYGLKTIEKIALKYSGDLDIDCSGNFFKLLVLLKN